MTGRWWPEFSEQHGLRAVRTLERGARFSRKARASRRRDRFGWLPSIPVRIASLASRTARRPSKGRWQRAPRGCRGALPPSVDLVEPDPGPPARRIRGDRARADAAGARRSALGSDPAAVNEQVALFVMIETATGMENAAEIASVPGVDGIFVGPADLALMMGLQPEVKAPTPGVEDALNKVAGISVEPSIVAGLAGGTERNTHG
ncbi:aldolase/citrate lyase family protein [Pseudonocardia halophobica]|uniref:aldolase/citrate lyase family protein n=1 Tax=Pseudonocardia halophobica TaxID=29401 RepID=UPI003D8CB8CD